MLYYVHGNGRHGHVFIPGELVQCEADGEPTVQWSGRSWSNRLVMTAAKEGRCIVTFFYLCYGPLWGSVVAAVRLGDESA
jgi:hypothetical protein